VVGVVVRGGGGGGGGGGLEEAGGRQRAQLNKEYSGTIRYYQRHVVA